MVRENSSLDNFLDVVPEKLSYRRIFLYPISSLQNFGSFDNFHLGTPLGNILHLSLPAAAAGRGCCGAGGDGRGAVDVPERGCEVVPVVPLLLLQLVRELVLEGLKSKRDIVKVAINFFGGGITSHQMLGK